jgi:hypothetical protein
MSPHHMLLLLCSGDDRHWLLCICRRYYYNSCACIRHGPLHVLARACSSKVTQLAGLDCAVGFTAEAPRACASRYLLQTNGNDLHVHGCAGFQCSCCQPQQGTSSVWCCWCNSTACCKEDYCRCGSLVKLSMPISAHACALLCSLLFLCAMQAAGCTGAWLFTPQHQLATALQQVRQVCR